MKILVGTLCQQGQVYSNFLLSMLDVYQKSILHKNEVARQIVAQIPNFNQQDPQHKATFDTNMHHHTLDVGLYTLGGESLLARGRNHMAQVAMTEGWNKLFFIDADEGFTWENFMAIAGSPYPVAAGLVPLKTYVDYPRSFKTSLNFLPFLEDECFFVGSLRTLESTLRLARAKKSDWIKVAFTGTGFLCIDVGVFAKLAETAEEYTYPSPRT